MDREFLLDKLPPYEDSWILINPDQNVSDIMKDIENSHKQFAPYYNDIALYFDGDSIRDICNNIYTFLDENIQYSEESEEAQTTALPTGILIRGYGDCKHYASFSGGVLDAITRLTGKKIKWKYRFASYRPFSRRPHHVYVIVWDEAGKEIWIDPTPGANIAAPLWVIDKRVKVSGMALYKNIAGLYDDNFPLYNESVATDSTNGGTYEPQELIPTDYDLGSDESLSPEIRTAISLLLQYQVLDQEGNFNSQQLYALQNQLPESDYTNLLNATYIIDEASQIGGLFQDIFRGVKKVTLSPARGAYLGLVSLNVFGLATKLAQVISTEDGAHKVRDKWYSLGGDWAKLRGAINNGKTKKKIFGNEVAMGNPAVPAWIATASAIIAALAPIIKAILQKQQQDNVPYVEGYDPSLINKGYNNGGIMDWIKSHPVESVAAGLGILFLLYQFNIIKTPKQRS